MSLCVHCVCVYVHARVVVCACVRQKFLERSGVVERVRQRVHSWFTFSRAAQVYMFLCDACVLNI